MKALAFVLILLLSSVSLPQSGRRAKEIKVPVPPPAEEVSAPKAKPTPEDLPRVTAEKNEEYRCTDDGTLARIIDTEDIGEFVVSGKEADTRVVINSKPKPSYTKEARRMGIQGFVVLRLLLSGRAKVGRIRVVKGLPAGLTENAIRAACRMEFKPAMKGGRPVAQWVVAEYVFRLADSSIFSPYRWQYASEK
jgi:TonB family protein